ncbi:hypothetical protein HPB48_005605 [Haemaphysalis longicornis]|uniref:Telomeric repeat-binding factor 2-interacting protein 1 n=1 Tax=Haemaphysalis longicornis TaxID=44386 RepID=A0A9J6GFU7_HAELO|nr:hypothetical protein HPB48_005605 [Haemaphysalis longicornis]
MSGKPRRRSLFTKVGGGPMCFSLTACSERNEIRELIERGGGVLLHPDTMPDEIRLVPSSTTAVTDSGDDVFSVDYIRACSEKNRLCPRRDFKVPMPPIELNDSKKRTPRPARPRREYTLGEDIAIARFIAKQPGVRIKGNAVYKEMAAAGVVPGKHPWQSLRQRYLKVIRPMRQLYESPASSPPARSSRKASGSSRCDTPEQRDLVEDSQDNFSPNRKRQAAHELEIFDSSNTKDEAVAESQTTPLETPAREETRDEKRKRRNRNSSSISLVASSCERSSGTQGSLRNGWEQKAGRKGDEIKSSDHWQDLCEDPAGKLKLQTSLRRARKRTPMRSSDNGAEAQSRQGINSGAVRTKDCKTVVGPLPARSNKQQTLPTTPKTSKKGVQVHAKSVEIDSEYDFEVSPGLIKPTTQDTQHRAHCSNRLRKTGSRQSLSGRLEHTPSPGNTHRPMQSPARKRGRRKLVKNSIGQSSTRPESRSNNVGTCETDFENPPALACVAEATVSVANSTCSPECMPIRCHNLHHLSAEPCLEPSGNDSTPSKTNSEDPLRSRRSVVKRSLLRATLLREHSKANGVSSRRKGSSKEVACLEKRGSSTRAKASTLRKQTRPSRPAEQGGTELAIIAMDKEEDTDAGHFDSADKLIFQRSMRQAPYSPMSLDSADKNPLARVGKPCDDNVSI